MDSGPCWAYFTGLMGIRGECQQQPLVSKCEQSVLLHPFYRWKSATSRYTGSENTEQKWGTVGAEYGNYELTLRLQNFLWIEFVHVILSFAQRYRSEKVFLILLFLLVKVTAVHGKQRNKTGQEQTSVFQLVAMPWVVGPSEFGSFSEVMSLTSLQPPCGPEANRPIFASCFQVLGAFKVPRRSPIPIKRRSRYYRLR